MKFHVPALCLAGSLLISSGAVAQTVHVHPDGDVTTTTRVTADREAFVIDPDVRTRVIVERDRAMVDEDGYVMFLGEPLYNRIVFYPDLVPLPVVAEKLAGIVTSQREEIAHLAAYAHAAEQTGFENIETVYEAMARDHARIANMAADWLTEHGFVPPPAPATVEIANLSAPASIDHMLAMHQRAFDNLLERRRAAESETVRTLLLHAAATTARHIDWLRTLDRVVDTGRKDMTLLLRSMVEDDFYARATEAELTALAQEELLITETTLTIIRPGTVPTQVIEHVVEVPTVVEKEVIVERPVERIVEKEVIVEKPVIVEKIVERPVIVERVAGQRQVSPRARARRPAK